MRVGLQYTFAKKAKFNHLKCVCVHVMWCYEVEFNNRPRTEWTKHRNHPITVATVRRDAAMCRVSSLKRLKVCSAYCFYLVNNIVVKLHRKTKISSKKNYFFLQLRPMKKQNRPALSCCVVRTGNFMHYCFKC